VKNQGTPRHPALSVGKHTLQAIRDASNTKLCCDQKTPNSRTSPKPTTINTQATHLPPAMQTSPVRTSLGSPTLTLFKPVRPPDTTPSPAQQKVKPNPLLTTPLPKTLSQIN